MLATLLIGVASAATGQAIEPEHAANPVYKGLLGDGFAIGEAAVPFPAPTLRDGQSASAQREALLAVAGSERKLEDMLRDSVSAPSVLKLEDRETPDGPIVRRGDLWFVVHADLDRIDPDKAPGPAARGEPREVANMRFEGRALTAKELKARDLAPSGDEDGRREWYVHLTGRLLDRIHVEATNRTVATRSADSMVVATRTDRAYDRDDRFPNLWRPIVRRGGKDEDGPAQVYAGGASYARITRLKGTPGALLVEVHFAFAEPVPWFRGNPVLSSKIGLAARDQIRNLRREIAAREE